MDFNAQDNIPKAYPFTQLVHLQSTSMRCSQRRFQQLQTLTCLSIEHLLTIRTDSQLTRGNTLGLLQGSNFQLRHLD